MQRATWRAAAKLAFALSSAAVFAAGCAAPSSPVAGPGNATDISGSPVAVPDVGPTANDHVAAVPQDIPAALVSADGLHITVTGHGGGSVVSVSLSARENADAVKLSLMAVPARCPCTANLIIQPVAVTLNAPLGDRRLIDAATGQTVKTMSGVVLAVVGWLPPGFKTTPTDALATSSGSESPGWIRSYAAQDSANGNVITITQYPGDRLSDPQLVYPGRRQLVDVNGHQGFTWHDGGADQGYAGPVVGRHVIWQQGGYTLEVSDILTRVLPGQTVLSETEVVRVARNLALPRQESVVS